MPATLAQPLLCLAIYQKRRLLPFPLRTLLLPFGRQRLMLQNIDLRALSEIRGNGRDVVSAYFSVDGGLSQLNARQRQLNDLLEDDELEAENFDRSMETIRQLLDEHSVSDARSICFFSSDILDFAEGYPIDAEVPGRLVVGPSPFIRPLAELQDEYETFAMVVCDNDRTRIFAVTNQVAEVEAAVRGGIKNHVRKGGWSQQRYERRRDEELARYADEIGEALSGLVQAHSIDRIVFLGAEETMRAIEEALSEQVADLIVAREPFDLHRSEEEMLEQAYESYFDEERQEERDLWQKIKGESMRDGRATTGADSVWDAAKIGRIEAAIVTRDAKLPAAKCRDCEQVTPGTPDQCQDCGSADIFSIDLVDALARQLELTSATLEFADEMKGLARTGHVAALLRY